MNNKDPRNMTDAELENTISQISFLQGKLGVDSYLEQWDMPPEILERFSIFTKVKLVDRVDWKGRKTEFVKVYMTELRSLYNSGEIDLILLGLMTALTMYIGYEDTVIRNEDGIAMTQKEIADKLKINQQSIKRYFKKLEELDIIYKRPCPTNKRSNEYLLSPEIFFKGVKINKDKKEFFVERKKLKKELAKVRKKMEKDLKEDI